MTSYLCRNTLILVIDNLLDTHLIVVTPTDSDSSETDTEELLRQEREKRIEAEARKRAVEEAKRNAEYLMKLVAAKKQAELERQKKGGEEREEAEKGRKEEMEEKKKKEVEGTDECDDERDVTLTEENCVVTDEFSASGDVAKEIYVGSNVEVFAKVVNGSGNSEQLYSPISSLALQDTPPSTKKNKFVPARWVVFSYTCTSTYNLCAVIDSVGNSACIPPHVMCTCTCTQKTCTCVPCTCTLISEHVLRINTCTYVC